MRQRESRLGNTEAASDTTSQVDTANTNISASSQQVSWWDVHEYVAPLLGQIGLWPMAGTPAWVALPDDDPAKLAALYDAAQHHALRIETAQAELAQASRDISAAADWTAFANDIRQHREVYIPRRVS